MKKGQIILIIIAILLVIGVSSSIYIVREDQVAVVSTFGEIKSAIVATKDAELVKENLAANGRSNITVIASKGLHFKIPFIQTVDHYTSKYLTYKSLEEEINTKDDKRIEIQMYAQYRIIDPVKFKLTVASLGESNKKMDDFVYKVVVQSANTLTFDEFFNQTRLDDLLDSRQELLNEDMVTNFGIYVTDIGINRKKFPERNVASVEEKMALQIEKDSEKLIAEGDSEYTQAQATADREKAEIVATAVEEAAVIKAEADADAIRIIQESLQKDLGFYQFLRRMEIYKGMNSTTVFVDGSSDIFDFLNGYDNVTSDGE